MIYDGWVYIAKSDTGHYKIGRSKNPFSRVKHFDTIMPVHVEIIALIPCDDYVGVEKWLHRWFAEERTTGEWFQLNDYQIDMFKNTIAYLDGSFVQYTINGDLIDGREEE